MTRNGRIAALVLAGAAAAGGALLWQVDANGVGLFVLSAMIVIGTVFEARYRGSKFSARGQWQVTGERELDHETGTVLEVWYDPVSGERRYIPAGQLPD